MRLIGLAVVLTLSLTVASLAAEAQSGKKARIGVLMLPPRAGAGGTYIQALREGLHEFGYVEGQNLLLEIRVAFCKQFPEGVRIDVVTRRSREYLRAISAGRQRWPRCTRT
jgi:hypothetical protein